MESLEIYADPNAPLGMSYLPVILDKTFVQYPGVSYTWKAIVDMIRDCSFRWPVNNIFRQQMEESVIASPNGMAVHRDFSSPI